MSPLSYNSLTSGSSSGSVKFTTTIPDSLRKYKSLGTFPAGIYTVSTNPTSTQATVAFFSSNSKIAEVTTTSGSVVVNLGVAATYIVASIPSSSNIAVTIERTAEALTSTELSGTLDTINSSQTYNHTGLLYVLLLGGGGAGGAAPAGTGGGTGYFVDGIVYTNSPTSITIGAGGAGAAAYSNGATGGTTSFGNLLSAGGGSGTASNDTQYGSNLRGSGGALGGHPAFGNPQTQGVGGGGSLYTWNSSPTIISGLTTGAGGGSSGGGGRVGGSGAVGNIGTGGNGNLNSSSGPGNNATGYGAGGGGGNTNSGSGSQGRAYILRGI